MSARIAEQPAYQRPVGEILAALGTDARSGLSEAEAQTRLRCQGRNELFAEPRLARWRRFLAQFQDALVILLLIATAISAGLWLYEPESALPYEAITIAAIVLLNAVMGYVQQSRAEAALAALRQMAAAQASVVRDGELRSVPATEIVPGDIILVAEGDTIPADARIIESAALTVAEAALTGESLPTSKDAAAITQETGIGDRHNIVFSGTTAIYGHGRAVVTATGMQAEMGRIAGMLKHTPRETTPLQKELDRVGRILGLLVLVIAAAMIATIILVNGVHGFRGFLDALIVGVALAVAAVPEGLPAIVTAVLAIGVQRMARRNAIIRHLAAVETLGSADVIASDKTGTLTKNEMTVRMVATASGGVVVSGGGYVPEGELKRIDGGGAPDGALRFELDRALTIAERANNAVLRQQNGDWSVQGDPTEGALIVAARKAGLESARLNTRFPRAGEVPFSSERKLMSTVHIDAADRGTVLVFTKGAPDFLLARCSRELVGEATRPLDEAGRQKILKENEALASQALRTLGVAFRRLSRAALDSREADQWLEHELIFVGLIGMIDPPRDEAKDAVARAKRAGIRPIMITGDHPKTAIVIARELGIASDRPAMTGAEIERTSDDLLVQTVREVSVYARVDPEHKMRLVKALQRGGAVVAMTGDGVNDAPALKTADIGIAMGISGTDVSKEAADMVLVDDNFATIVSAIEEGRAIFANIRKFLRYLLSSNIGEVMTMFAGVVLGSVLGLKTEHGGVVLPLLATQLLWINLVTDGAPALALGLDPADPAAMHAPPRPRSERVITSRMWWGIILIGIIMASGTLLVLDAALPGGLLEGSGTTSYAQTMTFNTVVLLQLSNVFNARSDETSAFVGMFANSRLWAAVVFSLVLQGAVIYVPFLQKAFSTVTLSLGDWLLCAAVASSVLWFRELSKALLRRRPA